jgi:hypothetical protein
LNKIKILCPDKSVTLSIEIISPKGASIYDENYSLKPACTKSPHPPLILNTHFPFNPHIDRWRIEILRSFGWEIPYFLSPVKYDGAWGKLVGIDGSFFEGNASKQSIHTKE